MSVSRVVRRAFPAVWKIGRTSRRKVVDLADSTIALSRTSLRTASS